jgi:hypothetical protein
MASLMNKIARFARSPQGQRLSRKAMDVAKDPATRRKIEQFRRRRATAR